MPKSVKKLPDRKVFDTHCDNSPSVIENLRIDRVILIVQPDFQLQGILFIAVMNGQMQQIILLRSRSQVAPKQCLHQNPRSAYRCNLTVRQQREVERHIAETGEKPVVLIDYLQIIAPVDVHFTDKQNLDRIVCALKKLSRSHELTIFAISSFNRENYNLEVSMNAFKESGGIDYSADVLMGLQARGAGSRTFNIDEEKRKDPRELELKILKNRSAAIVDPLPFRYYPAFSCFTEGGF